MTDIVERLRRWSAMGIAQRGSTILNEAADEIERLRAQRDSALLEAVRLRAALMAREET